VLYFEPIVADEEHGGDRRETVYAPFYVASACAGVAGFMPLKWWWRRTTDGARR
jgi:hypothetical protein